MKPEFIRQGPKLSEARLAEVEKRFGIQLPKEYRDFMLDKNGGEPEPAGVCRKRSKTPNFSCSYLYSIDAEPSYENWIWMYEAMKNENEPRLPKRLIPIGDDGGSNAYCLSVSGKDVGNVYWSDHEEFFVPDPPKRVVPDMTGITLVADSFEKFLNQFAEFPDENPEIALSNWVPLFKRRDLKGIKVWLKKGGKWDEFDMKSGRTPLTLAIELGDWPIVQQLINHGADKQKTLEIALQCSRWKLASSLLQAARGEKLPIDVRSFYKALENCDNVKLIRDLLDAGAPLHTESFGFNALHYATMDICNPEIVKLLLERGAKLEQSSQEFGSQSSLAYAISNGQLETAKILLDAGDNLYKDPQKKSKQIIRWENEIKQEESKAQPESDKIAMFKMVLENEEKQKPRAPIFYFDHPWKKFPPNFKKDVIAYAAKLGQKPPEA
jgi:hypothetical protein